MLKRIIDEAAKALGYKQPPPRGPKKPKVSKYVPHQGAKEMARRVRQATPKWLRT